jgi:molybdate/tungstate transport system substrate-binding protein
MLKSRRWLIAASTCLAVAGIARAEAAGKITVAYAGSMGAVMDRGLSPAFTASTGTQVQGIGEAAMGLAHLLVAKSLTADVFISVSAPPIKVVETAGLATSAPAVASTSMVLVYSPKSRFASAFASAKPGEWTKILTSPGLRFGRTDPNVDPQGQYVLFALQLASTYYKLPGFKAQVAGATQNPAQIFAEPSLLARLQDGQIDATLSYESAVISQHLPFIALPPEINFSTPSLAKDWYSKASLTLTNKGVPKTLHPTPLVYYATVMKNAPNPQAAQAFVNFLNSPQGQKIFAEYGYNPGLGKSI